MRAKTVALFLIVTLMVTLCSWRIYAVNHQDWIAQCSPEQVIYDESAEVPLSDGVYYISGRQNLEGYYVQVTGTELVPSERLLSEYDMTWDDLVAFGYQNVEEYKAYQYVYIITVIFHNENWETPSEDYILLDDFLLTGSDYYEFPASFDICHIPAFNPELGGSTSFSIGSSRTIEIKIPYLIKCDSITDKYIQHILTNQQRLLITTYPKEVYISLPSPQILEG